MVWLHDIGVGFDQRIFEILSLILEVARAADVVLAFWAAVEGEVRFEMFRLATIAKDFLLV